MLDSKDKFAGGSHVPVFARAALFLVAVGAFVALLTAIVAWAQTKLIAATHASLEGAGASEYFVWFVLVETIIFLALLGWAFIKAMKKIGKFFFGDDAENDDLADVFD